MMELLLEYMVRPYNYWELLQTDRALNPTTARHINFFHVFFETASLMLFLPQLPCAFGGLCGSDARLTILWAAITAVTSSSVLEAALGRFFLGLTFLRAFGLFRHWKKMWMTYSYKKYQDDNRKCSQTFLDAELLDYLSPYMNVFCHYLFMLFSSCKTISFDGMESSKEIYETNDVPSEERCEYF
jgi:hypothetical protein